MGQVVKEEMEVHSSLLSSARPSTVGSLRLLCGYSGCGRMEPIGQGFTGDFALIPSRISGLYVPIGGGQSPDVSGFGTLDSVYSGEGEGMNKRIPD